eukprot:TRINITY_DN13883_c0_g1_i1.p1 TRINITY_DN13883_c0_g1~~TRINITY_DN13883_c0_g1_i1.p1  ORF type:complete len:198 (-),score=30.26 TRINITY_DN13883_c0_g1_i1:139-732(-)
MANMASKAAIRKEMKTILKSLSEDEIKRQSESVTQKLLRLPEYIKAKRISIFLSMRDEVDTQQLLQHSLRMKKECFIPHYFTSGPLMKMVKLRDLEDYNNLPRTAWNIKQPLDADDRPDALLTGGLDLILVPGLAFSKSGDRCGRGKAYYDTYLTKVSQEQEHPAITVALAFKEQILDYVPTDSHDFTIDHVIYPDD